MSMTVTTSTYSTNPYNVMDFSPILTSIDTETFTMLAEKTSNFVCSTFRTIDRFLTFPLLGAAAENILSSLENKNVFPDCYTSICPPINGTFLHPREKQAMEVIGYTRSGLLGYFFSPSQKEMEEYLRFDWKDDRKKVLWMVGAESHNNAINPNFKTNVLSSVANEYDLKYAVIDSFQELCEEIDNSIKMGRLAHIIIDAHGNRNHLEISANRINLINEKMDFKTCFQQLDPSTKITIIPGIGESKDNNELNNLAQKIANASGRKIFAPTGASYPPHFRIDSLKPLQFKQLKLNEDKNILRKFFPLCDQYPSVSAQGNCFCPPCADLDPSSITERELYAAAIISNPSEPTWPNVMEALRLHKDDKRPKLLYLTSPEDHNGALHPKYGIEQLKMLNDPFDVKYKIVQSKDEICREIDDAAKIGKLAYVIIHAHGSPEGMDITMSDMITKNTPNLSSCFSGLDPAGKIILHSCSTAARSLDTNTCEPTLIQTQPLTYSLDHCSSANKNTLDNFAQHLANLTNRTTIAATELLYPTQIRLISTEPLMYSANSESAFFDPGKVENNLSLDGNIFRIFHPQFNCTVDENLLHDREKLAIDAINNYLKEKSIIPFIPSWEISKTYLRVCKEDPKPKFLFFTSAYDPQGRTQPDHNPKFLVDLNDKFDLGYWLVSSKHEICNIISEASKLGKIAGIAIQAPGIIDKHLILFKNEGTQRQCFPDNGKKTCIDYTLKQENILSPDSLHLKSCFSGLEPRGKILLLTSYTGKPKDGDALQSFAQRFADQTERKVIAPLTRIDPQEKKVASSEPFIIAPEKTFREFHPTPNPIQLKG